MQQLTTFQHRVLRQLANGRIKVYFIAAGLLSEKRCDETNLRFNEILQLAQWGFVNDVSTTEKYKKLHDACLAEEGRDSVTVWLNGFGQAMFERMPWEKTVN